jgi:hypothetical protein
MAVALIDERIGGALWIIWFVAWNIIGLVGLFYFRRNKNIELKKRFYKWSAIGTGATFFLLIALLNMPWFILLFFGAFIALIMYMNVRNTIICEACGKTIYNHMWFGKIEYCAKCGAKLPDR